MIRVPQHDSHHFDGILRQCTVGKAASAEAKLNAQPERWQKA